MKKKGNLSISQVESVGKKTNQSSFQHKSQLNSFEKCFKNVNNPYFPGQFQLKQVVEKGRRQNTGHSILKPIVNQNKEKMNSVLEWTDSKIEMLFDD